MTSLFDRLVEGYFISLNAQLLLNYEKNIWNMVVTVAFESSNHYVSLQIAMSILKSIPIFFKLYTFFLADKSNANLYKAW